MLRSAPGAGQSVGHVNGPRLVLDSLAVCLKWLSGESGGIAESARRQSAEKELQRKNSRRRESSNTVSAVLRATEHRPEVVR